MRFGHLLKFLNDYIIPVVKKSSPIVKIDYNNWLTKMYTLPFQVSLDPRVCIVNASEEPVNSKKFFPNLINWKYVSDDLMKAYGFTMNIYLNHSQILSSLEEAKNEKGDANLFDFLSSLCTAINKAMGGINNLEPIYDEDDHTIYIIDGSYSPENKSKYEIDLYGYDPEKKSSNFIRNFNLKTEITNEFATMATIGSTAGGYTKGVENTMFSKWNKGLQDPWKEKITPPEKAASTGGDDKSISQIYYEDFWMARYSAWGYTLKDVANDLFTSDKASLNDELIEKNLTLVTEFYKYCQSVIQSKQAEYSSPTNGFVPISLGLTMDGLSGIKIYNEINVNTKFLPKNYSDSLRFIVKGVNHKLSNSDWETNIETVVISNSGDLNQPQLPYWRIRQIIKEAILEGKTESQESSLPTSTAPTNSGSGAATAAKKKKNKRIPRPSYCPVIDFKTDDPSRRTPLKDIIRETKKIFPELSNNAIAGMLGVIKYESQYNPTAYNESTEDSPCGAVGLAQWLGSRQKGLFAYAKKNNSKVDDVTIQLKYLRRELTTSYLELWSLMKNKNLTLIQYVAIFHISQGLGSSPPSKYYKSVKDLASYQKAYEDRDGKSIGSLPKRYNYAEEALKAI